MDYALETSRQRTVSPALNPEVRSDLLQMSKNFPEQFFRHACVMLPVRMEQAITARRNAIPNLAHQTAMMSKRTANVVQAQCMLQLPEDQSQNMTRPAEYPRLLVNSEIIRKFRNELPCCKHTLVSGISSAATSLRSWTAPGLRGEHEAFLRCRASLYGPDFFESISFCLHTGSQLSSAFSKNLRGRLCAHLR